MNQGEENQEYLQKQETDTQIRHSQINPRTLVLNKLRHQSHVVQDYGQKEFPDVNNTIKAGERKLIYQANFNHRPSVRHSQISVPQMQIIGDQDTTSFIVDEINLTNASETERAEFINHKDNQKSNIDASKEKRQVEEVHFQSQRTYQGIVDQFVQHYNEHPMNFIPSKQPLEEMNIFDDQRMQEEFHQNLMLKKKKKLVERQKDHFQKQLDDILMNKFYNIMLTQNSNIADQKEDRKQFEQIDDKMLVSMHDFTYQLTESDFQEMRRNQSPKMQQEQVQNIVQEQYQQSNIKDKSGFSNILVPNQMQFEAHNDPSRKPFQSQQIQNNKKPQAPNSNQLENKELFVQYQEKNEPESNEISNNAVISSSQIKLDVRQGDLISNDQDSLNNSNIIKRQQMKPIVSISTNPQQDPKISDSNPAEAQKESKKIGKACCLIF